jgi:hypothetical protein
MEGEKQKMKNLLKPINACILIFVFGGFFGLFRSYRAPLSDFGNYYYGAKVGTVDGLEFNGVYNVAKFNQRVETLGERNLFLNHCTVSPQSVMIYLPLTWIADAHTAKMIFNSVGLLFLVFAFSYFIKWKNTELTWLHVLLLCAAQIPIYYNLLFGQTYLFITGFLLIAIVQAEKRPLLSGLLLGLAISLKISPAIFLLWFITQRKYRVVVYTTITCVLVLCTLFAIPKDFLINWNFFSQSLPRMMDGFISDPFSSSFQSVIVFLRKLMLPDPVLNPDPLISGSENLVQLINVLVFSFLVVLLFRAWKEKQDVAKKFVLLILFLFITSGYTSTYSLLLLVPFVSPAQSKWDWVRIGLYSMVLVFPPRMFDGYSPFLEEYKLWLFIALLIWESKVDNPFKRIEKMQAVLGTCLLMMIIFKLSDKPERLPLEYFKSETMKHDYVLSAHVGEGTIEYLTYEANGFRMFTVPYDGKPYYGPEDKEFGGKVECYAIGETESEFLVLSDYHRGPGLYHLYIVKKSFYKP